RWAPCCCWWRTTRPCTLGSSRSSAASWANRFCFKEKKTTNHTNHTKKSTLIFSYDSCDSWFYPIMNHPEHNVTGIDYSDRRHFRYAGPLIDIHSHVMQTRPTDPKNGPPVGTGPGASLEQAETMLAVAEEFGIVRTYSMCPADDIAPLRERFGERIGFN